RSSAHSSSRPAPAYRARLVDLARQAAAHDALGDRARLDELVQIDAGGDAHAVQHVHQIFGGQVAGGARGVGAATEAGDRRVERVDAAFQPDQRVGQGRAARVVQVQGELCG